MTISLLKGGFKYIKSRIMDSFKDISKEKSMINASLYWKDHFLSILMPVTLRVKHKRVGFILMKLPGSSMKENGRTNNPQEWENR